MVKPTEKRIRSNNGSITVFETILIEDGDISEAQGRDREVCDKDVGRRSLCACSQLVC
jgi:hypothetical protein